MAELAVTGVEVGAEVDIAARLVGEALVDERLDKRLHRLDVVGRAGRVAGLPDREAFGVDLVFGDVPLGDDRRVNPLFVRLADDLVVDVGEVLDIGDLISPVGQVPAEGVEDADRAGVAQVDEVVDGRPAGVDRNLSGAEGIQVFFPAGHGVVYLHYFMAFLSYGFAVIFFFRLFFGAMHPSLQAEKLWIASEVRKMSAWERALPSPLPRFFEKNRVKLFNLRPFLRDFSASADSHVLSDALPPFSRSRRFSSSSRPTRSVKASSCF